MSKISVGRGLANGTVGRGLANGTVGRGLANGTVCRGSANGTVGRGSANGTVDSEIKFAGSDKEKMYEPKHRRKLVRVLTVIAYLFSVSLAAIMLSLFYVFIYNPGKPVKDAPLSHILTTTHFHEPNQESTEGMKDTYLSMDREEPRALPVKGGNDTFQTQSQVPTNGQTRFNYSGGFGKENNTINL